MQILVIGNGNSIHTYSYIQKVLIENNIKVCLITPAIEDEEKYIYYKKNNVKGVLIWKKSRVFRKILNIMSIIIGIFIGIIEQKDYVHIHYVSRKKCILSKLFLRGKTKLILNFWGSDLMKTQLSELEKMNKYYDQANKIVFDSLGMIEYFKKIYGEKYNDKIKLKYFGSMIVERMSNIIKTGNIKEITEQFDIDFEKIIVVIGSNARETQQHYKIINTINKLNSNIIQKCCFVFPISYGGSKRYVFSLIEKIKEIKGETLIIEKYLSNEETARLRIIADVFVNAQENDAFAETIREFLFSNTTVLNGDWLDYSELDNLGIDCEKFKDFDELLNKLCKSISKKDIYDGTKNKLIAKFSLWENLSNMWLDLYQN